MFNIAPKRPNWDLKREMEKKLAKLDRRTQEAIHTLIRELQSSHAPLIKIRFNFILQDNGLLPKKANLTTLLAP